jgi:hypothetical protein
MRLRTVLYLVGLTLDVSAQPRRVVPGQESDRLIDAETRVQVVETTARKLLDFYVLPDVGKNMAARIRDKQRSGAYDTIQSCAVLAKALTDDIRSVSNDSHTYILYSNGVIREPPPPAPGAVLKASPGAVRTNFGFRRLEVLDGNLGYVDLRGFVAPEFASNTLAAAMNFLANTDALIIDLRANQGGNGEMVRQFSSYFFAAPVHIADSYNREGKTGEVWTLPTVAGTPYPSKPLFLLTSSSTFSAAEGFAYSLQSMKRAVVVGERTVGGAYGGGRQNINDHFDLLLSTSRSVSTVTHTDWEGTGVQPDIPVPAAQALDAAIAKAHQ